MAHPISFLKGVCIGAGAMYLFDPERGRRRRSLLRDQYVHYCHKGRRAADVVRKDAGNRLYGAMAEFRGALRHDEPNDETLIARVRAAIGHHASHASAIDVDASGGCVTLFGTIGAHEVEEVLAAVRRVRGVQDVQSALRVQDAAGNFAQTVRANEYGGRSGGNPRQEYWSPASRAAVGGAGVGLMAICLGRRNMGSKLLGALGFVLTTRAATNLDVPRMLGLSRSRRGIGFQTGIVIDAPIDRVYDLLSAPENYARLSDVISSVEPLGDGRYHKLVRLPGGAEVLLAERIVAQQKNQHVHWRSEPESFVPYAGAAWFRDLADGRTEVQVCMSYNPPGGLLSHAAASLAHMNPKMLMDDLLMRAKQYAETERQPCDVAEKAAPTAAGGSPNQQSLGPEGESQQKDSPRVEGASSPAQAGEPAIHNL